MFELTVTFIKASAHNTYDLLDEFQAADGYHSASELLHQHELMQPFVFVMIELSESTQFRHRKI